MGMLGRDAVRFRSGIEAPAFRCPVGGIGNLDREAQVLGGNGSVLSQYGDTGRSGRPFP